MKKTLTLVQIENLKENFTFLIEDILKKTAKEYAHYQTKKTELTVVRKKIIAADAELALTFNDGKGLDKIRNLTGSLQEQEYLEHRKKLESKSKVGTLTAIETKELHQIKRCQEFKITFGK
ncbi:MAG: hypothetical protein KA715_05205 [Xanthomonadaceae bacterium]|nr:hypothetical protein [Xanthomonadaceae bacterium]